MAKTRSDGHSHAINEGDRRSELVVHALESEHLPKFDGLRVLDATLTIYK